MVNQGWFTEEHIMVMYFVQLFFFSEVFILSSYSSILVNLGGAQ